MPISIVLASDSKMASELMSRELNRHHKNFQVVASVHSSKELLRQVFELQPDVALVSANLHGDPNGGLKALRDLRASGSKTRPILLVDDSGPEVVINAFAIGARGVICTRQPVTTLCECIRSVQAGRIWADSEQVEWVVEALVSREPIHVVKTNGMRLLTQREEEVVRMVAEGLPNSEISTSLGVSPHTVKNHLLRIYEKLGVSNRIELVLCSLSDRER